MNPLQAAMAQMRARGGPPGPGGPGGPPQMGPGGPGGPPPGMPPGMPPPGMHPGMPPMAGPGMPPPGMGGPPPGGMPGMGINPMSPMGMPDQKTTLLNNAVNLLQSYVQAPPMDENSQRVAGALRELMMVMTGGMSMPNGSIHGSVSPPTMPPEPMDQGPMGGGGIPNAPGEVL